MRGSRGKIKERCKSEELKRCEGKIKINIGEKLYLIIKKNGS